MTRVAVLTVGLITLSFSSLAEVYGADDFGGVAEPKIATAVLETIREGKTGLYRTTSHSEQTENMNSDKNR